MKKPSLLTLAALVVAVLGGSLALWRGPFRGDPGPSPEDASPTSVNRVHTCSMHPHVVQLGPGQCPICGMDLTPLESGHEARAEFASEGVRVSQNFTQNFAVRTTKAVRGHLGTEIRTVGYLDHNEEKVVSVSTKFPGWIERAHVNTIGERVSEGDILFEMYSPEIVTAQHEYLAAMEYVGRLRSRGAYDEAIGRAESLLRASRDRLRHWDLTAEQIARLQASGEPTRKLEVYAPASGHLVEKAGNSLEGMQVKPGVTVLKIADHSTLWAKVEFHERSVKDLRAGLRAEISLEAYPGSRWTGELLFFQPAMNPQTQTLTGFVEVDNSRGVLRPKMYADVRIRLPAIRNAVIVPAQSVLHTGDRSVVIIAAEDGLFVPREIGVGIESDGSLQVLQGVEPGERVVTSSQFLFDSESNLRTAIAQLVETGGSGTAPDAR